MFFKKKTANNCESHQQSFKKYCLIWTFKKMSRIIKDDICFTYTLLFILCFLPTVSQCAIVILMITDIFCKYPVPKLLPWRLPSDLFTSFISPSFLAFFMHCSHACIVRMHVLFACMHCSHACIVRMHALFACMHCSHACIVRMRALFASMYCSHACIAP